MGREWKICFIVILTLIFFVGGCASDIKEVQDVKQEDNMKQSKGPFCQSCAMPLETSDQFGVNADGSKNQEYCHYCFQNGNFTDPNITMREMIDKCIDIMSKMGMPEAEAREMFQNVIPKLKRWRRN